jgi:hypothetical protein
MKLLKYARVEMIHCETIPLRPKFRPDFFVNFSAWVAFNFVECWHLSWIIKITFTAILSIKRR